MIAALASSVAWGCSCVARPAVLQLPSEAHVRGPVRTFLSGHWPEGDVERLGGELRLLDPDGVSVPFEAEAFGWRLDLLPSAPMAPGQHSVQRRLSEEWFTVGAIDVVDGPAAPGPPSVTWKRAYVSSSCGPASVLRANGAPIPGARWLDVEVEDIGIVGTFPTREAVYAYVSDDVCAAWKVTLPADRALRVRAVAVGLDGSRAPGPWTGLEAVGPAHRSAGRVPVPRRIAVSAMAGDEADQCWDEPPSRSR